MGYEEIKKRMNNLNTYLHDKGLKSRKFILTLVGVFLISVLAVVWARCSWPMSILDLSVGSITTIVLGYIGINAARAAVPGFKINRNDPQRGGEPEIGSEEEL